LRWFSTWNEELVKKHLYFGCRDTIKPEDVIEMDFDNRIMHNRMREEKELIDE